ncbi:hypothetical protein F66182_128 [Fusarium sp. NRRL 66182]|nr:hypothetical protein F66182_128 [Fusarium sp. NRRL 66182]
MAAARKPVFSIKLAKPDEKFFNSTKSFSIPHLTELRKELGYGNAGQDKDIAFKKAVRTQIDNFVSNENLPAYRFTKWKTPAHQRGLLEITKDFLDTQGKGLEFWPDCFSHSGTRPLQYSQDSDRIHSLMVTVFWRSAREYKRYTSSSLTKSQLLLNSDTISGGTANTNSGLGNTDKKGTDKTQDIRGRSVNDPIDLEDMTSSNSMPRESTDNDPFAAVSISCKFIAMRAPREHTPDESDALQPCLSMLGPELPASGSSGQSSDGVNGALPATNQNENGTDLYDVPNSPPRVPQNAQDRGKRPAETNSNDNEHRAKAPRQEQSKSTTNKKSGKRAQGLQRPTRTSTRPKKPTIRQGAATQEEMEWIDRLSTLSSDSGSCALREQQEEDRINGILPSIEDPGQSSSSAAREKAARLAEREAAEAVAAARQPSVYTGPSSKALGKRRAVPFTQTPVVQAGPSTERMSVQEPPSRQETSTAGAENTQDTCQSNANCLGYMRLSDQERRALEESTIKLRSRVINGIYNNVWKLSDNTSIFQMSLASVARKLGLGLDFGTLYIELQGPDDVLPDSIDHGDEEAFRVFKDECLRHITREYRIAMVTPESERSRLTYTFSFSRTPNF